MEYLHGNLNNFIMHLPGEYIIAQKWEFFFCPTTPTTPPTTGMQCHQRHPPSLPFPPRSDVRQNIIRIFYRQIKTNRAITSYRRHYCLCSRNRSLCLLSLLVFTAIAFKISLSQGPERQYQSFEKVQVCKTFQELAPHSQNRQLNDSLSPHFRLRWLRSAKNSERFSDSYFTPCIGNGLE